LRKTAVRKIDRKVSVSIAASTASWNAGRKFTAAWLPDRASCSVSWAATSRRTAASFSIDTERSAKVELS
jgi:hypothetical protein